MCVLHAKFLCPLIHLFHEGLLSPCKMFCHCHAGIISGCDHNTFDHGFCFLCFPFFQIYLGTAHGFRISACRDRIIQMQPAIPNGIKDQDQRHNFCNACRASFRIRISGIDHCACLFLHQYRTWCFNKVLI